MTPDTVGPVTVHVLTGFLGSGKTTLLGRLLAAGELPGTAVLVNEVAPVPMDQMLLAEVSPGVGVLAGNCVCCMVQDDIRAAIVDLLDGRERGTLPPFSRIVIETSGMADPMPVLATVLADGFLSQRLTLGATVAVIDATNFLQSLSEFDECALQVTAADTIVLTKGGMAPPGATAAIRAWIEGVNPLATVNDADAPDALLAAAFGDDAAAGAADSLAKWAALQDRRRSVPAATGHRAAPIEMAVLRWPEAVDWAVFATWLSLLLHRHGARILRMKGLLSIRSHPHASPAFIQSVRHAVHAPRHLGNAFAGEGTAIVVIAHGLSAASIERSFRVFMGLSTDA